MSRCRNGRVYETRTGCPRLQSGEDVTCGRGYKIDVKSSTLHGNRWQFNVKENKDADYFLCLAFDDRDSLNPKHLWLIPGSVVNTQTYITVSESTVSKWRDYEKPVGRLESCCNTMKSEA